MKNSKELCNPFSTGGGGVNFEGYVQASFVTLMLSGGYAPCLPCWPIVEIKLQTKIEEFDTDDLLVIVENKENQEQRKLLGQIKHSIKITERNSVFGQVIQDAWNDFNNPKVFNKNKDIICLITGLINRTDLNVAWLLNHARAHDSKTFFRNIERGIFSSKQKQTKLKVLEHHLKKANGGKIRKEVIHEFLKHFYLLGYDLGEEKGVVLSLINSHLSQFTSVSPKHIFARIKSFINNQNQHAGNITKDNIPEDLKKILVPEQSKEIPENLTQPQIKKTNWQKHADAKYLSLLILLGAWSEKSKQAYDKKGNIKEIASNDLEIISRFLKIDYEELLNKAKEILQYPDSPLLIKNGVWKVIDRIKFWNLIGSSILNQDLDRFKSLAISVFKEKDPAFELPTNERYAATIHGKQRRYSQVLRKGIAEGLALLGNYPGACKNCSQGKAQTVCKQVLDEVLTDADYVLWGSFDFLLPTLAEAAPTKFLKIIEDTLKLTPCPFFELFDQEGNSFTGRNYLTGLLWALESLAWEEDFFIRVSVILGELASKDPGGQWGNRPFKSLITIFLPWHPQTLASADKRKSAINKNLFKYSPEIAWKLLIQLLPRKNQITIGSKKPKWRNIIPEDWEERVKEKEYWEQVSFYAELAVTKANHDPDRLAILVDNFDVLPSSPFNQLIEVLSSKPIINLPEEKRLKLWEHLTKFTNKHRRFADKKWALSENIIYKIDKVADKLSPQNPFYRYQPLFTYNDHDLYEKNEDWNKQRNKLNERRQKAISEIFQQNGINGVIKFAESVVSSKSAGEALGNIRDEKIDFELLPNFLEKENWEHKEFINGFIKKRQEIMGWEWGDKIDKSSWTPEQTAQFLAYLPFSKKTWERASQWLKKNEGEYWRRTSPNPYKVDEELKIAIEKLIENKRPCAAITCLHVMVWKKLPIDVNQCVQALLAAPSSGELSKTKTMNTGNIEDLIKFLQSNPSVNQDDLFQVEWTYLPLFSGHINASPKLLESKLANDPEFFCEAIQRIYKSNKKENHPPKSNEKSKAIANNLGQLLFKWKTPPGIQEDKKFNEEHFKNWLQKVKKQCKKSGHLQIALYEIGKVLIHVPPDPNGLWINEAVAEALNDSKTDEMREGFRTGILNSRGAHVIDPNGQPEKKLAKKYKEKAEKTENAGYPDFATTLKKIAEIYEKEANKIIYNHH